MSPGKDVEESESDRETVDVEKVDTVVAASTKAAAKRRTKTGCLTCRKRRIKCGEERPTCKNCVKSKRDCAGYVQPLVYKQHNQGTPPLVQDTITRTPFSEHADFQFNEYPDLRTSVSHSPYDPILFGQLQHNAISQPQSHHEYPFYTTAGYSPFHYAPHPHVPLESPVDTSRRHGSHNLQIQDPDLGRNDFHLRNLGRTNSWTNDPRYRDPAASQHPPGHNVAFPNYPNLRIDPHLQSHSGVPVNSGYFDSSALHGDPPRRYSVQGFIQPVAYVKSVPTLANPGISFIGEEEEFDDPDDPYDIEMEDIYGMAPSTEEAEASLTAMLHRSGPHSFTGSRRVPDQPRTSKGLQIYRPSILLSPLQEERNERVFCHFVAITSKCMSIFERQTLGTLAKPAGTLWGFKLPAAAMSHPALAHALLALGALHISKLQLTSEDPALKHFTYSVRRVGKLLGLPSRRHEIATLAAVLVLGFYEVVGADHSRWNLHLAGATKLMVEHDFAGLTATARRMRNRAKENIKTAAEQYYLTNDNYLQVAGIPESLLDDVDWEIDQALVSDLTGFSIDYDNQRQPNFEKPNQSGDMSEKDISDYKSKMDLRWWYCKQDVFQSMVSGDQLLMPFEFWKYCPPRGQIGNAGIPYATFDHLLLIVGRLTDFGGKDRHRKQRVVALQGGQWKPPPGFSPTGPPGSGPTQVQPSTQPLSSKRTAFPIIKADEDPRGPKASPAPSANEGRLRQSKPPPQTHSHQGERPMYGMMPPPTAPVQMHSSFHNMDATLRDTAFNKNPDMHSDLPAAGDLDDQTARALAEHAAIVRAFDRFASCLGPDFDPVQDNDRTPASTPFGPPLQYRSPEIACIWAHYNVGRILLHRMHPHMPPAAMISAGVVAHLTREYAQKVGKICAGLYSSEVSRPGRPLDPTFAGALMESTFPLLFAGIQYQDISQRGWTISKLQDIARTTGWQTSAAVAAACEIAWERMGQAGRGPPYTRTLDRNNRDARVSGQSRTVRTASVSAEKAPGSSLASEHESQFVSHDRSLIAKHGPTRVHWALGLLSVEEDIKKLSLGNT